MNAGVAVAEFLGLGAGKRPGPLWMAETIARGLPVAALDRVVGMISPDNQALRFRFVPRATLARRMRAKKLSGEESAKLARVASVFVRAREVWGGDAEARAFLTRGHPLLEDRSPLDVAMATEIGARLVETILGRLQYGTAA
jgi:putative toxin-antitoxin system antitoxin component (TIGR02293 family)